MTQQWNSSQNNAANVLSSGNLVATNSTVPNYTPGYATETIGATELRYWEGVLTNPDANDAPGLGLGLTTSSIASGQYLGIGSDTIGYFPTSGAVTESCRRGSSRA
jgi:hypothetical protein